MSDARTAADAPDAVRFIDERLVAAGFLHKMLRYVFPDHWSFLIGEIVLYSFVVLIATGVFLALFFDPSSASTVYHGGFATLEGQSVSAAYASTVHLSLEVPAGLLIRQTHHWAALVFVAAIVVHMMRVFFTGAFRKPRDVNWMVGLTLLTLALLEGFAGYSLPDDLLSGMGLAIAYAVVLSIPLIGAQVALLIWGGAFPGSPSFEPRLFITHVLLLPAALATLITVHLATIMRQKHSQFRGRGRREDNVVGMPLWPGYALRSFALLLSVAGVLVLLGGLVQINPIWQYGPFEPWVGTNGAQPDWYLGWLIGALRLMPALEIHLFGYTVVPNPFFGGILFPTVVFAILYAWPALERRITGDRERHDLLDMPREHPLRTALGAAFFSWVAIIFIAGSADRILVSVSVSYTAQVWIFRAAALLVPLAVFLVTRAVCRELAAAETHPLRGWSGAVLARSPDGGFVAVGTGAGRDAGEREDGYPDGEQREQVPAEAAGRVTAAFTFGLMLAAGARRLLAWRGRGSGNGGDGAG
jgi:ubiquinol-cytochrome c reductase cytochrome b subunit